MKEFGKQEFEKVAYINFDQNTMSDYREESWLTNSPLYNIDRVMKYIEE